MPFGLYLHIPFCEQVCHYCDFAKSTVLDERHTQEYFAWLGREMDSWLERLEQPLTSVFFGGGTPAMFPQEVAKIVKRIEPFIADGCEISVEANPGNVTAEDVETLLAAGVNRYSVGVQTFDEKGLSFLTRNHSAAESLKAMECLAGKVDNYNIDLIYGWSGQSMESWQQDLNLALAGEVPHISLYNLTYEPLTVLGRRERRGLVEKETDDMLYEKYLMACHALESAGYLHEEVSNWSKPGRSCRHNWLYWSGENYVGVGAGAHGYLASTEHAFGRRYAYGKSTIAMRRGVKPAFQEGRDEKGWLNEYVGSSLRTCRGSDLELIYRVARMKLADQYHPVLQEGMRQGLVFIEGGRIYLKPEEWFRETSWCHYLLESFTS